MSCSIMGFTRRRESLVQIATERAIERTVMAAKSSICSRVFGAIGVKPSRIDTLNRRRLIVPLATVEA